MPTERLATERVRSIAWAEQSSPLSSWVAKNAVSFNPHQPSRLKLFVGAIGSCCCFTAYGQLQQRIFQYVAPSGERFTAVWFLQLVDALVGIFAGVAPRQSSEELLGQPAKQTTLAQGFLLGCYGLSQAMSKRCLSAALAAGMPFAAATLGKVAKAVLVMLGSAGAGGPRLGFKQLMQAASVLGGIVAMGPGCTIAPGCAVQGSRLPGASLIALALCCDGATSLVQQKLQLILESNGLRRGDECVMLPTVAYAATVAWVAAFARKDIVLGASFCLSNPSFLTLVFKLAVCGAAGQAFLICMFSEASVVSCALLLTCRKLVSLCLTASLSGSRERLGFSLVLAAIIGELSGMLSDSEEEECARRRRAPMRQKSYSELELSFKLQRAKSVDVSLSSYSDSDTDREADTLPSGHWGTSPMEMHGLSCPVTPAESPGESRARTPKSSPSSSRKLSKLRLTLNLTWRAPVDSVDVHAIEREPDIQSDLPEMEVIQVTTPMLPEEPAPARGALAAMDLSDLSAQALAALHGVGAPSPHKQPPVPAPREERIRREAALEEVSRIAAEHRHQMAQNKKSLFRNRTSPDFQAQDPARQQRGVVVIFDWDDTLLPTTWLSKHVANVEDDARIGTCIPKSSLLYKDLEQHAERVQAALTAASCVGRAVIVTLARRPWVLTSSRRYLPGLDLEELFSKLDILVYYAWEHVGWLMWWFADDFHRADVLVDGKRNAMVACLQQLQAAGQVVRNVVSVGDSVIEQSAATAAVKSWNSSSKAKCKTVKFADKPKIKELCDQLQVLAAVLPSIARYRGEVDLSMDDYDHIAALGRSPSPSEHTNSPGGGSDPGTRDRRGITPSPPRRRRSSTGYCSPSDG